MQAGERTSLLCSAALAELTRVRLSLIWALAAVSTPSRQAQAHIFPAEAAQQGIFGVPLITSIPYANVAISLFNEHGESYIYGYVPIVVAKCGVFLKEKGRFSSPMLAHQLTTSSH